MENTDFYLVSSDKLFEQLAKKRYEVFVLELKRFYPNEFIKQEKLIEPIENKSTSLVLAKGDKIIGGIRMTPLGCQINYDATLVNNYKINTTDTDIDVSIFVSKLFITPQFYRNKKYLPYFMANIYWMLKLKNIKKVYLNTNPQLEKLYTKIGFRKISNSFYLEEVNSYVLPMIAEVDEQYLTRCSSKSYKYFVSKLETKYKVARIC